jgi:two-component system sensor histidine kinase UhpB
MLKGEQLSLRTRLNLMIALTMLLIIGLGFLFAIHNARRSVAAEVESTLNLALQLIEAGLAERRDSPRPISEWLSQLRHIDRTRHLRIHILQPPQMLSDQGVDPRLRPHAAPAWFVWAVSPRPAVAERRLTSAGQPEIEIRIEAEAGDEIAEAWTEAQGFLMLIAVLAAAVYALVHISVGRAFNSVGTILEGLEEIDKGDYSTRLPDFPLPEFRMIAGAFNHMATTLEHARDENRALTQQSLTIQEEERRYLAQELHDEFGQSLTGIKVMAAALRYAGRSEREPVEQIMAICDRLFGVVRGMMRRLRPIILDELGLHASLEDLIENWRTRNPEIELEFDGDERVDEHAGSARIHLFRIVQECLTNVLKHAYARHVRVALRLDESDHLSARRIVLEISDDGCGFDPGQPRRGFGLLGIRERVASLGGTVRLRTRPGTGVSLQVQVPSRAENG